MNNENEKPLIPKNLMHNGKRARSKSFLTTPATLAKQAENDENNSTFFTACVKRENATDILKDQLAPSDITKTISKKQVRFNLA